MCILYYCELISKQESSSFSEKKNIPFPPSENDFFSLPSPSSPPFLSIFTLYFPFRFRLSSFLVHILYFFLLHLIKFSHKTSAWSFVFGGRGREARKVGISDRCEFYSMFQVTYTVKCSYFEHFLNCSIFVCHKLFWRSSLIAPNMVEGENKRSKPLTKMVLYRWAFFYKHYYPKLAFPYFWHYTYFALLCLYLCLLDLIVDSFNGLKNYNFFGHVFFF